MKIFISLFFVLLFTSTLHAGGQPPSIQTHYHGATLFVGPTVNDVEKPQPVTSFFDYIDVYGISSFASPDRMASSARTFFRNGGNKLYVSPTKDESLRSYAQALRDSRSLEVDLVAIPASMTPTKRRRVMDMLAYHAQQSPQRFALIDPPQGSSSSELIDLAHDISTSRAAMYAPWVSSLFSQTALPPSPSVAGVISRIDRNRGVYKSPAGTNAVLKGVDKLAATYSRGQLGELNTAGVNIIRRLSEERPPMVLGARVLKDPNSVASPYIATQRFLNLLKYSITKSLNDTSFSGTDNARALKYKQLIKKYLLRQFRRGALLGAKPEEAYFAKCRAYQNDGIKCEVGVSLVRPAEFFISVLQLK